MCLLFSPAEGEVRLQLRHGKNTLSLTFEADGIVRGWMLVGRKNTTLDRVQLAKPRGAWHLLEVRPEGDALEVWLDGAVVARAPASPERGPLRLTVGSDAALHLDLLGLVPVK